MTYKWITMDWDHHCLLWVGSIRPEWDSEAGRWDGDTEWDLDCACIPEQMAMRLTRRDHFLPGDIVEVVIVKTSVKHYK